MLTREKFAWGFAGLLIIALILTQKCSSTKIVTKVIPGDTKYSVTHDTTAAKPYAVYYPTAGKTFVRHDTTFIKMPQILFTHNDTVKAAERFLSGHIDIDSFNISEVKGVIRDSIGQNKRQKRTLSIKNTRAKVEITPQAKEKPVFLLGFQAGVGIKLDNAVLAPQASLLWGKNQYMIGFDYINRTALIGMSWKLGK